MKQCAKPDYEGVAVYLASMIEDGGFSSRDPVEIVDALEPYGWGGCPDDEAKAIHEALVTMMRCEVFPGMWDIELAWRMARRLADLAAGEREHMLKLKADGWEDGIDSPRSPTSRAAAAALRPGDEVLWHKNAGFLVAVGPNVCLVDRPHDNTRHTVPTEWLRRP